MDVLDRLAGDAQSFIDTVWARRVHVHRSGDDDLAGLLSLDDVDRLLTSTALRTPMLRLARDGTVLPTADYTRTGQVGGVAVSGLVDPSKVLDLFGDGASIVLQGLHRYAEPVTTVVRDLELSLGHPCQANAYLTPPGSQGFALHCDTHDVFVVQTYGTKDWEVHDETGVRQVAMSPGTSMYLPTGTPHAARTQRDASLHVTIGINRTTWRQVMSRVMDQLLTGPELDEPLPPGYHRDPDRFAGQLAGQLARLADRVEKAPAHDLAAAESARFAVTRATAARGGLLDRLAVESLHDTTLVRRRSGSVCELIPDGDVVRVLLGDRELRVPGRLQEPLQALRRLPSLRPADLHPWLDEQSRVVLVRRLVREGLLEVAR